MFYNKIFKYLFTFSKMIFIIYLIIYLLVKKLYNVAINLKNFWPYCEMHNCEMIHIQ